MQAPGDWQAQSTMGGSPTPKMCASGTWSPVQPAPRVFSTGRWRPLLDGPLFGAFCPFGMDGSPTPRSEMAGRVARWANSHPEIWKSNPVKGDVGLVFVPSPSSSTMCSRATLTSIPNPCVEAYQAFFDSNIQPDFVALDNIGEYKIVYLPYPVMLKQETVAKLRSFVEQGGMLISEGLPAYFGDHGHVGAVQPNYGLDEVFGARESFVQFTPDISNDLMIEVKGFEHLRPLVSAGL